jgi:16S rRNA (uracil1498-N3)-methyltransferase
VLPPGRQLVFVDDLEAPALTDGDRHHLQWALRLRPGEVVLTADGRGAWRRCTIGGGAVGRGDGDGDRPIRLVPDGPVQVDPDPSPPLTIAFVVPKGDRAAWVVQKLTEVGVDRIVPLMSARSVVRWSGDRAARQVDRLRAVVREAAMQSRRPRLPVVTQVRTLADFAAEVGGVGALCQAAGAPPDLNRPCLMVGPEGGWSAEELAAARGTVGLGPTVLRAETAAVAAGVLLASLRAGLVLPSAGAGPGPPA